MNLSRYKKVLQHSVKRMSVFAALLAASALATHAQVVFSPVIKVSHDIDSPGEPQIAVDSAGNINTVWSDQTTPCGSASCSVSIFFSRSTDGGATFSAPLNLSNDQGTSSTPQIALDPSGNINVIWNDNSPGYPAVLFSRSVDGGHTFSTPKNISAPTGGHLTLERRQIAIDSIGSINVVWSGATGNIFFSRSTDGGANFSAPVIAGSGIGNPSIAVNSASISVVWEASVSGHNPYDVFFSQSADGGATFSTPKDVSNPEGAFYEQIAVAPDGSIDIIWNSNCQNTFFLTCPAGPSSDVFFSQSKDSGASFSVPLNLSNTSGISIRDVRMIVEQTGNIDVVWPEGASGFFSRSADGGTSFSAPRQISNGFASQMAVDPNGNINVADALNGVSTVRSTDGGSTFSSTSVGSNSSTASPQAVELMIANLAAAHPGPPRGVVFGEAGSIESGWTQAGWADGGTEFLIRRNNLSGFNRRDGEKFFIHQGGAGQVTVKGGATFAQQIADAHLLAQGPNGSGKINELIVSGNNHLHMRM